MTSPLPDRPDLDQLRRRAKELRDSARRGEHISLDRLAAQNLDANPATVTLAAAQLVIARELGFASWPKLKSAIGPAAAPAPEQVETFLAASVDGRPRLAARLLDEQADLAVAGVLPAAVLGDAERVRELLEGDPSLAHVMDDRLGWPPLLYACYSCWGALEPRRASGFAEVVRLLLDAGASPATNNGGRPHVDHRSALHGAVSTGKLEVVRLLLDRGAMPGDPAAVRAAAASADPALLQLLLDQGATLARSWAFETAAGEGRAQNLRLLLDATRRTGGPGAAAALASGKLADAAAKGNLEVVEVLLEAGADPAGEGPHTGRPDSGGRDSGGPDSGEDEDSLSPLRRAVRAGHKEVAERLVRAGAPSGGEHGSPIVTPVDRFLGALARADQTETEALISAHPGVVGELSDADRAAAWDAAASGSTAAVKLMLSLGFSPRDRNEMGETPLHTAAYSGRAGSVELLLAAGAEIDALDSNFDATALAYATVGSGERPNHDGDWVRTVRALLDAGATRDGVFVDIKPPSEEVEEVLRAYGIEGHRLPGDASKASNASKEGAGGEDAGGKDAGEKDASPALPPTPPVPPVPPVPPEETPGAMAEMAEQVRAAYESADLELFASLLDPAVTWGAGEEACHNRDQVLAFYRAVLAGGVQFEVCSVEAQGNSIMVEVRFSGQAEGARARPPETRTQILTVAGDAIVAIDGRP